MQVDDFFAYQLKEQREEEAEKRAALKAKLEKEASFVTGAQKNMYEERCINCDSVNCLVIKSWEGTQVCKKCGVIA